MPQKRLSFFQALPPYFGGKRKLIPWIFGQLAQIIPPAHWSEHSFADAFVGGGSISLYVKAQGFREVLANDWSTRSQIVIQGLLENNNVLLHQEDVLRLAQGCPAPGFVETHFASQVFSQRHARALDQLSYGLRQFQNPTKQALASLLIWHLISEYVCFSTSIGTSNRPYAEALDGLRDWQGLNPKRFTDGSFSKLLNPTWASLESLRKRINRGVFGGSPVTGYHQDAFGFVQQAQADILYLDPPYPGTLSYESSNRVLDAILTSQFPQKTTSPFSQGVDALETLLDGAQDFPIWLLSYGNHHLNLEELVALVKRHAGTRTVKGFGKTYRHLAHVAQTATTQELLVIAH